ncbi:MAG: phosphodiesterase [Eubacteriales bacterium]
MKLLIASDLHGSAYYTRLTLDMFEASGAERLLLLGDLLYHGPRNDLPRDYSPKKTAAMLNGFAARILAVRGNCEAEVDSLMLDFPVTSDYAAVFDGEHVMYLSHGHRVEPKMPEGSIYLTGHTHVPHDFVKDGVRYLNPGSAAIPKNGSPHSVMLYDNGAFRRFDIETGAEYSI